MFVPFTTLSGNDERPNMATPVVLSTSATITMQKIFIGMPVNTYSARKGVKCNNDSNSSQHVYSITIIYMLTISYTFRYPYENTIAFGGVDMGIMKAKDADTAAGIIR